MKKYIYPILLVILVSLLSFSVQTDKTSKLIWSSESFFNSLDTVNQDPWVFYLESYYKIDKTKILGRYNDFEEWEGRVGDDSCSWEAHFSNGFYYQVDYCGIAGSTSLVKLPGVTKNEVVKLMDKLYSKILNEELEIYKHEWNADSTQIMPVLREAGCYHKIIEEKDGVKIEYGCGC